MLMALFHGNTTTTVVAVFIYYYFTIESRIYTVKKVEVLLGSRLDGWMDA